MTDFAFRQQVAAMREAQRQYFACKDRKKKVEWLLIAKQLERDVDEALTHTLSPQLTNGTT